MIVPKLVTTRIYLTYESLNSCKYVETPFLLPGIAFFVNI